ATGVLAADVAGVTGGRTAAPLTLDGAPDFAAEVAATDAPVCRFVTTHPPMASSTANPKRMGQRYFCRASGASIGTPSPPPGRLSLERLSRPCGCSCCWAAPEAVSPGDSVITPVPFSVKPSGWPGLVCCATLRCCRPGWDPAWTGSWRGSRP